MQVCLLDLPEELLRRIVLAAGSPQSQILPRKRLSPAPEIPPTFYSNCPDSPAGALARTNRRIFELHRAFVNCIDVRRTSCMPNFARSLVSYPQVSTGILHVDRMFQHCRLLAPPERLALQRLSTLRLSIDIDDGHFETIAGDLPQLRNLHICGYNYMGKMRLSQNLPPGLQVLEIEFDCQLAWHGQDPRRFQRLGTFSQVDAEGSWLVPEKLEQTKAWESIGRLRDLEELSISWVLGIAPNAPTQIANCTKLRSLKLKNVLNFERWAIQDENPAQGQFLSHLAAALPPSLETLSLCRLTAVPGPVTHLLDNDCFQRLTKLSSLELYDINLVDYSLLNPLANNLVSLAMTVLRPELSVGVGVEIPQMKSLKDLYVYSEMSPQRLAVLLQQTPQLEYIIVCLGTADCDACAASFGSGRDEKRASRALPFQARVDVILEVFRDNSSMAALGWFIDRDLTLNDSLPVSWSPTWGIQDGYSAHLPSRIIPIFMTERMCENFQVQICQSP